VAARQKYRVCDPFHSCISGDNQVFSILSLHRKEEDYDIANESRCTEHVVEIQKLFEKQRKLEMKKLIFVIGLFLFLFGCSFVSARNGGGEDGGMQDQMMNNGGMMGQDHMMEHGGMMDHGQMMGDMMGMSNQMSDMMGSMAGMMQNMPADSMGKMSGVMKDMSQQMMEMSQAMATGKVSAEQMKHMQNRMTQIQQKLSGMGMQK